LAGPMRATRATNWLGEKKMPPLRGAVEWLNSKPLDAEDLRGKVVLVDFWTFTCINWRRTLPYLRAWQAKYQQGGLVIIGIHTPEFTQVDALHRECVRVGVGSTGTDEQPSLQARLLAAALVVTALLMIAALVVAPVLAVPGGVLVAAAIVYGVVLTGGTLGGVDLYKKFLSASNELQPIRDIQEIVKTMQRDLQAAGSAAE
jgi:thiol-disulfide isomerase/thioredoxin